MADPSDTAEAPLGPPGSAPEQPPLGSWNRLYTIVLGELVLLVLLFTLFARTFR